MTEIDFGARLQRARSSMEDAGVDVLLLSLGADLPYLTGYRAPESERLTMAVVPVEGDVVLLVPHLEAPRVAVATGTFELRTWKETEDPVAIVGDLCRSAGTAAISDQTWATFLLRLHHALPDTLFTTSGGVMADLRLIKEPAELELLRGAGTAADRVVDRLRSEAFSSRTERQLASTVVDLTLEEGHEVAGFAVVASGRNGASPHHEATDRVMEKGDAVVVDFGGRLGGYHSDTTRTFHVGEAPAEYTEAYEVLHQAQRAAVGAVQPGVLAANIDRVARKIIADAGFGEYFIHRTGHGIGLEVHEPPYLVEGNDQALEVGMAFSVEPGIYLPDRWGMRIEDIVAVTAGGAERLNNSPRDLAIVE